MRGRIDSTYEKGRIKIVHDEIPGFMPAMTMPFFVEESDVAHLKPGDRVVFKFRVGEHSSRATDFRKIDAAPSAPAASESVGETPKASRLRPGDQMPEFSLVDQDGQAVDARGLRGGHTLITFIFTRCPVPEYCPLLATKFLALQREPEPEAPANRRALRLLSVTLDPEHDVPAVLREYGAAQGADFSRWSFVTGEPAEVDRLARAFRVRTERNNGSLDHSLATALIGPEGRIVEIWRGNGWKPKEVLDRIERTTPPESPAAQAPSVR